ncbi:sensor kinase SpoOB-type protein [Anaerospora hongkongensis]|uniref:Sensor kinase SpoOB-type protein n=1 Tax=Anaerospora hongkongensis TaxID=244830 RepID=A0A4R1PYK4_9FIRM|nr:Spo0B domain-containing protein [Anaerospora hongkongensis]TCL36468.1 sensor kinase SpoOB-type protein [Anaerospora hongkongensis]
MAKLEVQEEVLLLLKMQRHDFINHLQVIHAMIQLGKMDKALIYIEELSKDPNRLVTEELTVKAEELTGQLKAGA